MENNMLQAILDEIKNVDKKIDGVASDLKSFKDDMNEFREETKKEFNQINVKLDRLEENQPKDIKAHLKQLQNVDNKTELLNKRLFDVESRLKNWLPLVAIKRPLHVNCEGVNCRKDDISSLILQALSSSAQYLNVRIS